MSPPLLQSAAGGGQEVEPPRYVSGRGACPGGGANLVNNIIISPANKLGPP